jgi:hypothetical protein
MTFASAVVSTCPTYDEHFLIWVVPPVVVAEGAVVAEADDVTVPAFDAAADFELPPHPASNKRAAAHARTIFVMGEC